MIPETRVERLAETECLAAAYHREARELIYIHLWGNSGGSGVRNFTITTN
jgi:hypothetical protein